MSAGRRQRRRPVETFISERLAEVAFIPGFFVLDSRAEHRQVVNVAGDKGERFERAVDVTVQADTGPEATRDGGRLPDKVNSFHLA